MKLDIEKYEQYALLGTFGPIIAITFVVFIILVSPFALLGYLISKVFKLNIEEIVEWYLSQDNAVT